MSNPVLWWKERLVARFPLSSPDHWQENYSWKRREGDIADQWPGRVSRQDLYKDYTNWVNAKNEAAWPNVEAELRRPLPVTELIFYSTLSPMLYIGNKARMVKNYHVKEQRLFEGRYLIVKKRRYFIRLASWQEHVASFCRETGTKVF